MKKRYLVKIVTYNTRYIFYTEDELYANIHWMNNVLYFNGENVKPVKCEESVFLKNINGINNLIKLMNLFPSVKSIEQI